MIETWNSKRQETVRITMGKLSVLMTLVKEHLNQWLTEVKIFKE